MVMEIDAAPKCSQDEMRDLVARRGMAACQSWVLFPSCLWVRYHKTVVVELYSLGRAFDQCVGVPVT
jgi:hypothetical protein